MTEYVVGAGGDFDTLNKAANVVKEGDVVRVLPGVYRESLTLDTPDVIWTGEGEVVIDGGWNGKKLDKGWANVVVFAAPNVTFRGIEVRNAPGRAFWVNADDVLLEDCVADTTYQGAILVGDSSGAAIENVVIRGNVFRNMSLAWIVGDRGKNGRSVNGSFNIQNTRDSLIGGNTLYNGMGEGINIGRGSVNVVVCDNVVHSMAHVLIYVNRAEGTQIIDNRLYHIPDKKYGGPKGDNFSAAIVIGDESGPITSRFPASHGTVIRGNLVVNAGKMLQVRNNADNYDTQLLDTVIAGNTFIAGPSTEQGIMIQSNPHGRPHKNSVFRNNVIDFTYAPKGAVIASHPQAGGIVWENNAWSRQPVKQAQGEGDFVGDLMLAKADAKRDDSGLNVDNYRPLPGSPLLAGEALIGALPAKDMQESPVEPEPEPPVDILPDVLARLGAMQNLVASIGTAAGEADTAMRDLIEWLKKENNGP